MIRLEDLSLDIGGLSILRNVSLEIAPGRITGLVGESGSGKSMTALAVMGLLPRGSRARGHVRLDAFDGEAVEPGQIPRRLRGGVEIVGGGERFGHAGMVSVTGRDWNRTAAGRDNNRVPRRPPELTPMLVRRCSSRFCSAP